RNVWKEYVNPAADAGEQTRVAKIASLVVKVGALMFVIFLPTKYAIDLQLLGGVWILQTLPSIIVGLFTRWFHKGALVAGWAVGMSVGTWMAASQDLKSSVYALNWAGIHFTAYEAAFDEATPGDLILVDRGTYPGVVVVPASKPNITIRGVDRNAVALDGTDTLENGIVVHADGVTLQNLSAHDFLKNGFYWEGVRGFTGSYLTVWNVLGYGIYAEGSTDGLIEHDYVSGAADAADYVGECDPCRTTLRNLVARLSAVGYSGTTASGSLVIRDSLWDRNGAGI